MIGHPSYNPDHATRVGRQGRAIAALSIRTERAARTTAVRTAAAESLAESLADVVMPANASDAHRDKDAKPSPRVPIADASGAPTGESVRYRTATHAGEWRVRLSRAADVTRTTAETAEEREHRLTRERMAAVLENVARMRAHVITVGTNYAAAVDAREDWTFRTPADPTTGRQSRIRTMAEHSAQSAAIIDDFTACLVTLDVVSTGAKSDANVATRAQRAAYRRTRRAEIRATESADDRAARLAKQREATRRSRERKRAQSPAD